MGKTNQVFTTALRTLQSARGRTLAEIQRAYAREQYTDEFKRSEASRMIGELKAKADALSAQAAEAVAAKIEELDAEEQRLAEIRAIDSDYLNRLNLKIENAEQLLHKRIAVDGSVTMDELSSGMTTRLKGYFAEFHDDSLAVSLIRERLGHHGVVIAPEDITGKRQEHLRAVQTVFNGIMNKGCMITGSHGLSEVQDVDVVVKGEENAFIGYCNAQNGEFSLNDNELIAAVGKRDPENKSNYDGILWKIHIAERRSRKA